jgi:hypothetical protein
VRRLGCWNDEEIEHLVADSLGLRQFCRVYPQALAGGTTLLQWAHLIGAEALAALNNRGDEHFFNSHWDGMVAAIDEGKQAAGGQRGGRNELTDNPFIDEEYKAGIEGRSARISMTSLKSSPGN